MKKDSIFNEEGSYFNSIYYIRKGFENYLKENRDDLDINRAESRFLSEIYYNEGISQRELAHNLFVSEPNVAKSFKKLEKKGLVYKKIDEDNNTRRQLYLTEKGLESFEKTISLYEEYNELISTGVPKEEIQKCEELLKVMAKNALKFVK